MFIYFWEREGERWSANGEGVERQGDTESEAGSRLWAVRTESGCRAWTHETRDHDLSWSRTLNCLSHPGAPCMISSIRHCGKGQTIGTKIRLVVARAGGDKRGLAAKAHRGLLGWQKWSTSQMWWWLHNYTFVKTHQTVFLKRVNFIPQ